MDEWRSDSILPGMRVCDADGETIGSVRRLFRPAPTAPGTSEAGRSGLVAGRATSDGLITVNTGAFGLQRLYIPLEALRDLARDCVNLTVTKYEFEHLGWYEQPDNLTDFREEGDDELPRHGTEPPTLECREPWVGPGSQIVVELRPSDRTVEDGSDAPASDANATERVYAPARARVPKPPAPEHRDLIEG